jgi:hypothetical protein
MRITRVVAFVFTVVMIFFSCSSGNKQDSGRLKGLDSLTKSSSIDQRLIGKWISDPKDSVTQKMYGNVEMDFQDNGDLVYIISTEKKDQIIRLKYWINGNSIISDQLSHPSRKETTFEITKDRKLHLTFENDKSVFVRK